MEYTIENDFLRVTVTCAGAQIKSVLRKSDGVEHMWNGDPAVWKYHSPVMFPYAGKVKDGMIEIRGQKVENAPAHGFARTSTHYLVQHTSDSVTLELLPNEATNAIFPYCFRFLSNFKLEGDCLHHTLTVENNDNEAFSFGIGYHPAFAIPFDSSHTLSDYEFRFSNLESPICMEAPVGLINGKTYSLGHNIQSIPVTDGMFDNGSHCMVNLSSHSLGIYEKGSSRAVVCDISQFPYCLIWSQPGTPKFLCIEPWHSLPSTEEGDYSWSNKSAAAILQPGTSWSTTMKTRFVR